MHVHVLKKISEIYFLTSVAFKIVPSKTINTDQQSTVTHLFASVSVRCVTYSGRYVDVKVELEKTNSKAMTKMFTTVNHYRYSGPSLEGHSREDTPLERTEIPGSKYYECV